jgi:hypothetical protein
MLMNRQAQRRRDLLLPGPMTTRALALGRRPILPGPEQPSPGPVLSQGQKQQMRHPSLPSLPATAGGRQQVWDRILTGWVLTQKSERVPRPTHRRQQEPVLVQTRPTQKRPARALWTLVWAPEHPILSQWAQQQSRAPALTLLLLLAQHPIPMLMLVSEQQ